MPIRIPAHKAPASMAPGQISIPPHPRGQFLLANPDLKEVKYSPEDRVGPCMLCALRYSSICDKAPCEARFGGAIYYELKD